jgi:hypothetical protein
MLVASLENPGLTEDLAKLIAPRSMKVPKGRKRSSPKKVFRVYEDPHSNHPSDSQRTKHELQTFDSEPTIFVTESSSARTCHSETNLEEGAEECQCS